MEVMLTIVNRFVEVLFDTGESCQLLLIVLLKCCQDGEVHS